jgi:hypothetical protein
MIVGRWPLAADHGYLHCLLYLLYLLCLLYLLYLLLNSEF